MTERQYKWHSATRSEVGMVRQLNEDAILARPEIGLWTVADGMGGHSAGDLASQMIVNTLSKIQPASRLSELVDFVEHGIVGVNNRLFEMGQANNQTSGSTVVVLLASESHCVYMWAGDSRLYRLRGGGLEQMTTDHTEAELYIEQGLIERNEAGERPGGDRITRAVGAANNLFLDLDIAELSAGDRFLLCSDGLDKHLGPDDIAVELAGGSPEQAADRLVELTMARGATDNVSVCVVDIE